MSRRPFKILVIEKTLEFLSREVIVKIGKDLLEGYFNGRYKRNRRLIRHSTKVGGEKEKNQDNKILSFYYYYYFSYLSIGFPWWLQCKRPRFSP